MNRSLMCLVYVRRHCNQHLLLRQAPGFNRVYAFEIINFSQFLLNCGTSIKSVFRLVLHETVYPRA